MWVRVLTLTVLCRLSVWSALDQYEGKVVSAIQFEPARSDLRENDLRALLPLKVGQPLSTSDLRASIQRLYATGEYEDVVVDASLDPAGTVRLRFITTPAFFVGYVSVKGVPEPPSRGQLVTATRLQLGAAFNDRDVNQAIESLQDTLRRNGFYNAGIVHEIEHDSETHEVKLRFFIHPGWRARFAGIQLTGQPERSARSIIASTGWKPLRGLLPWRGVTDNRLQSGLDAIRSWYPSHSRLLANVTLTKLNYEGARNRVTPEVDIQPGPLVKVKVEGAKISGGRLRSLLPIYQERTVDKDLLMEGRKNLVAWMQSQGYFEATADYSMDVESGGDESINYQVEKGERHRLVRLAIQGNKFFDEPTLRERMYVIPATLLRYRWGRYSHEMLEKDLNAIRDLYRSNGFRDVQVTSREVDDYQGRPNAIAVFIDITEGPQWFVSKLDITGASRADEEHLRQILHSTEGQPYSEYSVATDRDSILEFYFNSGYPDAKFDFTPTPADEPEHVALRYRIDPGERQYVREVIVNGLERTDPDLVNRRVTLQRGDPLSQTKMTDTQRRLYDLGIFARVNAAIQNPDGIEPSKYVVYSVEEARKYSLNLGVGAEIARIGGGATTLDSPAGTTGFSPRASIGINRLNFLGLGHTIGLQTLVSTLQQRALFTYLAPQFEGSPNLSLQFAGLFNISRDVRTFSAQREEGSVQLGKRLSKANTVQFRYTFRKVNILGRPLVSPELIPLLSQPVRVGLIGFSFIQDRRDDPVDARHGVYNTLDFSFANNLLGSQTGFGRVVARNATYHRVTRNLTLARSTFFGLIDRYAGLPEIPLAERFFSGGSSSNRAFPDNQAGPRDPVTGFPIGGNALLMNSVEFRFPLIGENVGGVLFNDMGNVYSGLGSISLRWRQRDLQDFDYAVQSFGFGIRYRTPVGPIRVDLSLSPNSPRFFGYKGTYDQLLFGTGQQVAQRINIFQFHISLGQAF